MSTRQSTRLCVYLCPSSVRSLLEAPEALSTTLTVFKHGGQTNGEEAVRFVETLRSPAPSPGGMKVGDLRAALEGVPDDLEMVVRAWDDDGGDVCVPLQGAEVQHAHDESDTPYFALDASPTE